MKERETKDRVLTLCLKLIDAQLALFTEANIATMLDQS